MSKSSQAAAIISVLGLILAIIALLLFLPSLHSTSTSYTTITTTESTTITTTVCSGSCTVSTTTSSTTITTTSSTVVTSTSASPCGSYPLCSINNFSNGVYFGFIVKNTGASAQTFSVYFNTSPYQICSSNCPGFQNIYSNSESNCGGLFGNYGSSFTVQPGQSICLAESELTQYCGSFAYVVTLYAGLSTSTEQLSNPFNISYGITCSGNPNQ